MARLRVKNVGPIKSGLNDGDGFVDFEGITVFIGDQGTGKSTIAKLFSTMSWIEKSLMRGDYQENEDHLTKYNRYLKQIEYQGIVDYLAKDSQVEYLGRGYRLHLKGDQFTIDKQAGDQLYSYPKIMYVPAERNFVSAVGRPDLVKRLPSPLYTFLDEYQHALEALVGQMALPIGDANLIYDSARQAVMIAGDDYDIGLLNASSGYQSVIPMILVTRYLVDLIHKDGNGSKQQLTVEDRRRIREEIDRIYGDDTLSDEVRSVLLERVSARFSYQSLINIVEEPEQNLYPHSQRAVLHELIKANQGSSDHRLVMTTHSPYLIHYLSISLYASSLHDRLRDDLGVDQEELMTRLLSIVPQNAMTPASSVRIYEMGSDGSISRLPFYYDLPSDENMLNERLADINDDFSTLLEIQDALR